MEKNRQNRQKGPLAIAHRKHRSVTGPKSQLPPGLVPQYMDGPRHGQQLALIRSLGGQ